MGNGWGAGGGGGGCVQADLSVQGSRAEEKPAILLQPLAPFVPYAPFVGGILLGIWEPSPSLSHFCSPTSTISSTSAGPLFHLITLDPPPSPPPVLFFIRNGGGGGGGGMIRVKQQATCASKNGAPVFKSLSGLVRKGLEGKREGCLLLNDYYKNCYRQRLLSWLPSDCLFLTFRSSMKPFQSQVHYLYHLLLTVFMQLTQTATVIFST